MDNNQKALSHFGVPGMRWGHRAGPRVGITNKRDAAFNKKDLKLLDSGKHLSVGITKKRQEAFDKNDRKIINKRIEKHKNEPSYADKVAVARLRRTDPAAARRLLVVQTSGNDMVKQYHTKRLSEMNPSAARAQKTRDSIDSIFAAFSEDD